MAQIWIMSKTSWFQIWISDGFIFVFIFSFFFVAKLRNFSHWQLFANPVFNLRCRHLTCFRFLLLALRGNSCCIQLANFSTESQKEKHVTILNVNWATLNMQCSVPSRELGPLLFCIFVPLGGGAGDQQPLVQNEVAPEVNRAPIVQPEEGAAPEEVWLKVGQGRWPWGQEGLRVKVGDQGSWIQSQGLTRSFTKPLAHGFVAGYFLYPIKFFKTSVSCTVIAKSNRPRCHVPRALRNCLLEVKLGIIRSRSWIFRSRYCNKSLICNLEGLVFNSRVLPTPTTWWPLIFPYIGKHNYAFSQQNVNKWIPYIFVLYYRCVIPWMYLRVHQTPSYLTVVLYYRYVTPWMYPRAHPTPTYLTVALYYRYVIPWMYPRAHPTPTYLTVVL